MKIEAALRALCLTQPTRASSAVGCACGSDIRREATAEQSGHTPQRLTPKRSSKHLRNSSAHQAENDRRSQRNKDLTSKNLEPNIPRQPPKAQLLQPRRERVDQQQRQENNNQPAGHKTTYNAYVRSPCAKPMGSHSVVPKATTLNNSPISCSVMSFCAMLFSSMGASTNGGNKPQLIRKCA